MWVVAKDNPQVYAPEGNLEQVMPKHAPRRYSKSAKIAQIAQNRLKRRQNPMKAFPASRREFDFTLPAATFDSVIPT